MSEYIVATLLYMEGIEFVRFLGAGGVSGGLFAAIFLVQHVWFKVDYRITACCGFVASLVVGFVLHKYWTFRDARLDTVWLQLALFGIKKTAFFGVNYVVLEYMVERRAFRPLHAQILIAISGAGASYVVTKWIFSL